MPQNFTVRLISNDGPTYPISIVLSDAIQNPQELTLDKVRQAIGQLHGYKDYYFSTNRSKLISSGSEPNVKLSEILYADNTLR